MTKQYFTTYKIAFLILGIIFITWNIPFIVEKVMQHREEQAEKFLKKYGPEEPLIENFDIKDIGNLLETIFTGIVKILFLMLQVAMGIPFLLTGIGLHVLCAGQEFADGLTNGLKVLGVLLKCSSQAITNFFNGQCTIYYIIDVIFGTMYKIFIELPIVLLRAILGLDLQFVVDLVHDLVIVPIDGLFHGISGYHIIKWPDSVILKCYKCTGSINGVTLDQTYADWGRMFNCTNSEIFHALYKIFYSIFPVDRHWPTWAKGQHLQGDDDATS